MCAAAAAPVTRGARRHRGHLRHCRGDLLHGHGPHVPWLRAHTLWLPGRPWAASGVNGAAGRSLLRDGILLASARVHGRARLPDRLPPVAALFPCAAVGPGSGPCSLPRRGGRRARLRRRGLRRTSAWAGVSLQWAPRHRGSACLALRSAGRSGAGRGRHARRHTARRQPRRRRRRCGRRRWRRWRWRERRAPAYGEQGAGGVRPRAAVAAAAAAGNGLRCGRHGLRPHAQRRGSPAHAAAGRASSCAGAGAATAGGGGGGGAAGAACRRAKGDGRRR